MLQKWQYETTEFVKSVVISAAFEPLKKWLPDFNVVFFDYEENKITISENEWTECSHSVLSEIVNIAKKAENAENAGWDVVLTNEEGNCYFRDAKAEKTFFWENAEPVVVSMEDFEKSGINVPRDFQVGEWVNNKWIVDFSRAVMCSADLENFDPTTIDSSFLKFD